jgi:hypothetical protein
MIMYAPPDLLFNEMRIPYYTQRQVQRECFPDWAGKSLGGKRDGRVLDFSGAVLQEFRTARDGYITLLRGVPRVSVGGALITVTDGECLLE